MVAIPRTLIDTRSAPELLAGAPFILIAVDNDGFLELPGMPLDMDWDRQRIRHRPSLKYLEALLPHGADPCEEYGGSTAWNHVIDRFSEILHDPEVLEACQGSPIWHKTAHLVHNFARRFGRDYRESVELERLCQILEVGYENLEISDDSEDESKDESVDASQDTGYHQHSRKRKWTD
ncbi:uncharacterized protein K444DRAFT_658108 [Hyaloscypha bicolor E]|uniref:Uncharacterized protein n=1 Tax=Hyaloscypha bicolor E TaxID=1095630 RepID=A0A2J6TV68_9HELO|nr:uncharacterized protein K444DRAFT_658108 [Hyaloscypha bicolor E]PMD66907.1 hypothetical protein K444DRAFT_658108 [Hyaloscypha bicolor E]